VSLIFTLIALALLALSAIALVRSVDTATLVMGNLGFKQDATSAGSKSTESAVTWLQANYANLTADMRILGYYSSSLDNLDATGAAHDNTMAIVDWDLDGCASAAAGTYNGTCLQPSPSVDITDSTGRTIGSSNYLVARLCSAPGSPNGRDATGNLIVCSQPPTVGTSTSESRNRIDQKSPNRPDVATAGPYFRIVVRTLGGRNTVSYTETIVHF
jgi:hypothetical protein